MPDEPPWYYRDGVATEGPFSTESLRGLLQTGTISEQTWVARSGWTAWRCAGDMFPDIVPTGSRPPRPRSPEPATLPPACEPPTSRRAAASPKGPSAHASARTRAARQRCVELRCTAGPDAGRSLWVGPGPLRLGREAGLLDPTLGALWLEPSAEGLRARVESGPLLEVEQRHVTEAILREGTRFRFGSSLWCVGVEPMEADDLLRMLSDRLNRLASIDRLEGFSLRAMFSEVFAERTSEEIDDYFLVGTAKTTPPIEEVPTGWPKPWLFARILLFLGLVYFGFFAAFQQFENRKLLPGLILMGSTAVPFATLVLFYELNTPRNVSFRAVLSLFFLGGVVSLFVTLLGFHLFDLYPWLGASSAGIIEESSKLMAVVLMARALRHRYILNGMLFGAAVGAGFAGFESAGYAFEGLDSTRSFDVASGIILLRALFTPFGHVPWTAFAAGVLWRVKGSRPFAPSMLADRSFLKAMTIPVALHMLWNAPITRSASGVWLIHGALGVIGWYVLFGLIQQGLRQVRDEQRSTARRQLETTQFSIRMSTVPPSAMD